MPLSAVDRSSVPEPSTAAAPAKTLPAASPADHVMQCMEVWGGNQSIRSGVTMDGLRAWVFSQPFEASANGGDVYYVSSCATGRITRLLIADVTGHGAAVQRTAAGLRDLMRKFVNYIDQGRFVRDMNEQFLAMSANGNFATAIVATYFGPTGRLALCNAGHPSPLLYRASTGRWEVLHDACGHADNADAADPPDRIANLPLGVLDLSDYDQLELDLGVGDLVLCYTDAFSESHDAIGEMLQPSGLAREANGVPLDPADPSAFVDRLVHHLRQLHAANVVNDDVTTLLFRCDRHGVRVTVGGKILTPLRVARGILASWFGRGRPAPWPQFSIANIGGAMFAPLSYVGRRRSRRALSDARSAGSDA